MRTICIDNQDNEQVKPYTIHYFWILIALLCLKSFFVVWLIYSSEIGLGPDEAQYWTWSKMLDWGYYSKPPGIAWQIWPGLLLFGETELGVKFFSIVFSFLIALGTFLTALNCRLKEETAFWAAVVIAFSPLGLMSSFLAITDIGMVLFWTAALGIVVTSVAKHDTVPYCSLGLLIALGALFKWPIYLFWIPILMMVPFFSELRSRKLWQGIAISLFGLLPSLYWNAQHNWATFRHVWQTIINVGDGQRTVKATGNFFDFLGSQFVLVSPIWFFILLVGLGCLFWKSNRLNRGVVVCWVMTGMLLGAYLILSSFKKIQGNWCDFVYPSAAILIAWFGRERMKKGKIWLSLGLGVSLFLITLTYSIPYLQSHHLLNIPYKWNPFRHQIGWTQLKHELASLGYNPSEEFLFADKYQITSILSFYNPQQKRAYFFNLSNARRNQFHYWPTMSDEQIGKTGFFVAVENGPYLEHFQENASLSYQVSLQNYFEKVEYLGAKPLFKSNGEEAKIAVLYKCSGYNGKIPITSDSY